MDLVKKSANKDFKMSPENDTKRGKNPKRQKKDTKTTRKKMQIKKKYNRIIDAKTKKKKTQKQKGGMR